MTASLSHDRPCLVSTLCTSVGPIKPPPYSRPVSRPFGMFARTFPLILSPLAPNLLAGKGGFVELTLQRPSQSVAWNRSALSEDAVRDRKLWQLCLASSRISKFSTQAEDSVCCVCLTAAWRLGARPLRSIALAVIIQEHTLKHAPPGHCAVIGFCS